jgi:hypothetical protein
MESANIATNAVKLARIDRFFNASYLLGVRSLLAVAPIRGEREPMQLLSLFSGGREPDISPVN